MKDVVWFPIFGRILKGNRKPEPNTDRLKNDLNAPVAPMMLAGALYRRFRNSYNLFQM